MFCTTCGNNIPEGNRFCTQCGTPAFNVKSTPVSTPVEEPAPHVAPVFEVVAPPVAEEDIATADTIVASPVIDEAADTIVVSPVEDAPVEEPADEEPEIEDPGVVEEPLTVMEPVYVPAPAATPKAYEYKVLKGLALNEIEGILNEEGRNGWRVIGFECGMGAVIVLERPITE